jgi:RHS repeat-associated protein
MRLTPEFKSAAIEKDKYGAWLERDGYPSSGIPDYYLGHYYKWDQNWSNHFELNNTVSDFWRDITITNHHEYTESFNPTNDTLGDTKYIGDQIEYHGHFYDADLVSNTVAWDLDFYDIRDPGAQPQTVAELRHYTDPVDAISFVGRDYFNYDIFKMENYWEYDDTYSQVITSEQNSTHTQASGWSDELLSTNIPIDSSTHQVFWQHNHSEYAEEVSNLYSTTLFLQIATNQLASSMSDQWSQTPTNAFRNLSDYGDQVNMGMMVYRMKFQAEEGTPCDLKWVERFTPSDGSPAVDTVIEEKRIATGDVDYTTNHVVWPPNQNGTITVIPPKFSGCSTCLGGGAIIEDDSVNFSLDLGRGTDGGSAGRIYIYSRLPTNLGSLAALSYDYGAGVSNVSGVTYAPEMVVWISGIQPYSYNLNVNSGGVQTRSWTIQNPDSTGATSNRLNIIEIFPNQITNSYTWIDANQQWQLVSGNGLRTETKVTTSDAGTGDEIVTDIVQDQQSNVVSRTETRFHTFPDPLGRAVVSRTRDPGGVNQMTIYSYYTNTTDFNYGRIQMIVPAIGPWTHYVYDPSGNLAQEITGVSNTPPSLSADTNGCRVVAYDYNPVDPADDGTLDVATPRTTIVNLSGHEVSRSYNVIMPNKRRSIVCKSLGAAYNDPANLVTTTTDVGAGNPWVIGMPATVDYPDGTRESHFYSFSAQDGSGTFYVTNTTLRGAADPANVTNVLSGAKTIAVMLNTGRTLSTAAYDIESTMITSQEMNEMDSFGRVTRTDYLDGTHTGFAFDCCGLGALTNRDGSLVTYDYDALKREIAQHTYVNATDIISTSSGYDPVGNVISTERIGTDGSPMPQSFSTYDLAGQLTSTTDALGNVTHYTNYIDGSGELIKTTTYPDVSTRVETYLEDGSLASVTGTAVHGVRYVYGVEQDGGIYRPYAKEIKLNTNGTDTTEWTKTYTDAVGRAYKTVFADNAYAQSFYNNQGQLTNQVDPDNVSTLYAYNAKGERAITAVDMNQNGGIEFAGTDRITMVTNDVITDNGANVNRSRTYVWETSVDAPTLAATSETSVEGLQSWSITWNNGVGITNHSVTTYDGNGGRFVTNTAPDGSYSISVHQYGQLMSVTSVDSLGNQLSATTYGYDPQGRQSTAIDARSGTTTMYYNNADQVTNSTTPSPDGLLPGQSTTVYFDSMSRVTQTTLPDNTSTTNLYYSTGELHLTVGSRTYPVEYTYDYAGRMKTMQTWTNYPSGNAATTTWNYDLLRGFMTNKTYDGPSLGPTYTYTSTGRLKTRLWARGITTTYGYNAAGNLQYVVYSDTTAGTTNGFDRLGRTTAVTNGITVCLLAYNDTGGLLSESYSGGPLGGLTVTNIYDNLLRRTNLSLRSALGTLASTTYGYDAASRLYNVGDGTNSATYSYVPNSPLISQIHFTNSGALRMTTTKQYDFLSRLTAIQNSGTGVSPVSSFSYANNTANQRTSVTNTDGSFWIYQYDNLGQVTSGKKYWPDGTLVAGQQFEYWFDTIGNRKSTSTGGDASGANLRTANYSVNSRNQYTQRDVPGNVDIQGSANTNASVTVNGQNAYRKGAYFREEIATNNTSGSVWLGITNVATFDSGTTVPYSRTNSGSIFLAQTPEQFAYDADGNLTNDGRWSYSWDAENRLTNMTSKITAPVGSKLQLNFVYDYRGRRVQKTVFTNNSSSYFPQYTNRFAYDGWNLIAVVNPQSSILQSFEWGSDLSGSMQGAGGVGGLLILTDALTVSNRPSSHFVAYDANGNVNTFVNATAGTKSAMYVYGPFGEVIRATGTMANANPLRFSSVYTDVESALICYAHRYFGPANGHWLSRDPIDEPGFGLLDDGNLPRFHAEKMLNPYVCVSNDLLDNFDCLGLNPSIAPGTVITSKLSGGGKVTVVVGSHFSPSEIATGRRGECLTRRLLRTAVFAAPFTEVYWGTFTGTPVDGITLDGSIFINVNAKPISDSSPYGVAIFGGVLAHEADHYFTGSDDGPGGPSDRINIPLLDKVAKALKDPVCGCCKGQWQLGNLLNLYACQCGLTPPNAKPCPKR